MRGVDRQHGYTLIEVLAVVAVIGVIGAMAVPITGVALDAHRFRADAQALANTAGLAKMRASAAFTRARLRVDLDTNSYLVERWNRTTAEWEVEGGRHQLSRGVTFGFAGLGLPPPDTQATIEQAPACRTGLTLGTDSPAIANTACIVFNSRGLPVDGAGALYGGHAVYLTNGATVYGTTVTATPRIRLWWTAARSPNWREQR
jgi:prepilin-type N-terminal cleavage/methylation domain-containing protein